MPCSGLRERGFGNDVQLVALESYVRNLATLAALPVLIIFST